MHGKFNEVNNDTRDDRSEPFGENCALMKEEEKEKEERRRDK